MNSTQNTTKKICLIGGSFDPIHLGHTYIAEKCHRELGIDKLIFLPCRRSPHKLTKQNAPDHHRLEMCHLATAQLPWAEVSDFDLTAPEPSYSWRTAEHFQSLYPNAQLYWLMGTDQWKVIHKWNRPQHLASIVKFIVVSRGESIEPIENFTCIPLSGAHTASATLIRSAPDSAQSVSYLHPQVLHYLNTHSIYPNTKPAKPA